MKISICISTRRRVDGLIQLLESINCMKSPGNCEVLIIIVENDNKSLSEEAVKNFSLSSVFPVKYVLEVNQGISYARNRSVMEAGDSDFCCFVDDDQIVHPEMLVELVGCMEDCKADAVSGCTPPEFRFDVPEHIRMFHEDTPKPYGTIISQAATGCLLIRKKLLDQIEGPFNLKLNFMGGEDYYMTYQFTKNGGKIVSNPKAISYEIIPTDRATIKYVIKRTIRTANTKNVVLGLTGNKKPAYKALPKIIGRLVLGAIIVLPHYLFGRKDKLKGIFKISYSIGELMFIFGKNNKFYI